MSAVAESESMEKGLAGRLADRLAGRVQSLDTPWAAQIVSWMDLVDLCRELDDQLTITENPSHEALTLHKTMILLAIGCGERLIDAVRSNEADISTSGQTHETLEASLELLRILRDTRHSDFSLQDLELLRRRIFNAAA